MLENPRIRLVIEYSEGDERSVITADYNGPAADITKNGDHLSLAVLGGMVSDMRYTLKESEEMPNELVLEIRNPKKDHHPDAGS